MGWLLNGREKIDESQWCGDTEICQQGFWESSPTRLIASHQVQPSSAARHRRQQQPGDALMDKNTDGNLEKYKWSIYVFLLSG